MLMKDTMDLCIEEIEGRKKAAIKLGFTEMVEQYEQHLQNLRRIRNGQSYGLLKGDDMFAKPELLDAQWEFNQKINPKPPEVHEKFMAERAESRRVANSKRK